MSSLFESVNRLIEGFRNTALIATAVRLKIIDGLSSEPRSAGELAAALKLDQMGLTRLLRGLAVLEIVEEQPALDPRFSLTPAGVLLRSGNHLASYALLCETQYLPAWTNMEIALREAGNPFQAAFGKPVWQYRHENPEAGALFNQWLHAQSSTLVDDLVAALDFSSCRQIADIGGGKGILLSRILQQVPGCRGLLGEQPSVLDQADLFLRECRLRDRCDLVPIDFFVSVPAGCDTYLLKSVLHDWNDTDALRILASLREAMSPGSRLFIIERTLPALAREDPATVWLDLMMMNVTGGRERTLPEYEALLAAARLAIVRLVRTPSNFHVMKAAGT